MNAQTALAILGALFGLLLIVGAATVYLRQGSISGLRQVNEDLRKEINDEKRRRGESDLKTQRLESRVDELVADNSRKDTALVRIGEQAVGTADIRELATNVQTLAGLGRDHDQEAARRHAGTIRSLREIRTALEAFATALEHRTDPEPPTVGRTPE